MPYSFNPFTGKLGFKGCNYVVRTRPPTSSDTISFAVPTIWVHTNARKAWLLVEKPLVGGAIWLELGAGGVDFKESVLSVADCTAVPPTEVLGDRYIVDNTVGAVNAAWDGAAKNDVVEFDGSVWLAVEPDPGAFVFVEDVAKLYVFDGTDWQSISVAIADMTAASKGVGELCTDAETIDGTLTDYHVVNPSSLKAKLGTQTDHGVLVGSGTAAALTALAVGSNGQVLVGSTTADPVFATLGSADSTIAYTIGAGTLTLQARAGTEALTGVLELATAAETTTGVSNALATHPVGVNTKLGIQTLYGVLLGSGGAGNNLAATAAGTNGQVLLGSTTANPVFATMSSTDGSIGFTLGAGTLDLSAEGLDQDNIYYVGKHGDDANSGKTPNLAKLTIQSAVTVAIAGDTILVYPGSYNETITHAASNVALRAEGKPTNVIITQADANVVDFGAFTGIQYKYFGISCTAATSALCTVQGSTGGATFKECQLEMTSAAAIVAVTQPSVGCLTGAGALKVTIGKVTYANTGACGGTANKGAFKVADGGVITLQRINDLSVLCSGTALVTSVGVDTSSTGVFEMNDNKITVTDPNATIVAGFVYLGGTGITHEFFRNTVHVTATNNAGYGFWSADTASSSRFFYNHIHVVDTAGTSNSFLIGNTATVISEFDDIIAEDGVSVTAGGTFTCTSSEADGDLTCRGREAGGVVQASIMNMDNTATAGNAACNISVGGTTSTGDPYTQWLITGSTAFSAGIDNSDADTWKLGRNVNPSTGTSDIEISATTGAVTFSEVYEFPVADGTASYPLITDGAGNLDFAALSVAGGGTGVTTITAHALLVGDGTNAINEIAPLGSGELLIGSGGVDPVAATLTNGNNITFTNAAGSITANLTGTTQYAVQVGNATNSLDSLGLGNATEVLTSNGGAANPSWQATATAFTWSVVTVDAGLTVNTGVVANKAGLLTMTLPATAVVGDKLRITGINTAIGWRIAQNANQTIHFGASSSTTGVAGYIEATAIRDSVELVCVVAGASTEYNVTSSVGNLTVS